MKSMSFEERNPYVQTEHAPGCDKMVCAYSLGGEQCCADKKSAIVVANEMAKTLGGGWLAKIHQNLGWHPSVVSPCGSGKTPVKAIAVVRKLARAQVKHYANLLDMVTNA